ncbi:MAG TPA: hypothetical protein DCX32_01405 [Candidatus Moranbacteria bacterium]|nr:MAG: hypothetical protein UW87_C0047G0008 [Candidatus Moranbacteria bacterium GW2011_GWC2_45_10]KKT94880.1 MAG: hypothetical protein UW95_C0007G0022 [Parcubacteria group bacterium GW2011_GWC1_45_14]HAV11180.1 hypothetical protein [Candidatus Moranbacteria bacterium]
MGEPALRLKPVLSSPQDIALYYFAALRPNWDADLKDLVSRYFDEDEFHIMTIVGILSILEFECKLECFHFKRGLVFPEKFNFVIPEIKQEFESRFPCILNGWNPQKDLTIRNIIEVTEFFKKMKATLPRRLRA